MAQTEIPGPVLIIGASSYVGARIYEEFQKAGLQTLGTFSSHQLFKDLIHLDISNAVEVREVVEQLRPKTIVLAAAVSNLAAVSANTAYAEAVNLKGCENIVRSAASVGAKLIYLSTEAVFQDNQYGRLKKEAEEIIKGASIPHLILRLGMCFGRSPNTTNDRPHNRLIRAIEANKPASFDALVRFYPTEIGYLSRVILTLLKRGVVNETIAVISMPETTRFEIARYVLKTSGIEVRPLGSGPEVPPPPLSDERLRELGIETLGRDAFLETVRSELQKFVPADYANGS